MKINSNSIQEPKELGKIEFSILSLTNILTEIPYQFYCEIYFNGKLILTTGIILFLF